MGVVIRVFVPAMILFLSLHVPRLYAFSLGEIEVKSNFGERFNAEIPIVLEKDGKAKVRIGVLEDYAKLGLQRPAIVDDLEVKSSLEDQGNNKIIRIVSIHPLFFPSFNLVVRAETNGGSILENYLVAVDFQQNVALSLKGKKETENIATEPSSKIVETPQEAKKLPEVLALPSSSGIIGDNADPDTSDSFASSATSKEKPGITQPLSPQPKVSDKDSKPLPLPVVSPASVGEKSYGPIQRGESLWGISEKVARGSTSVARTSVALWMANKNKFVGGNIHGVKVGEILTLEDLDKHLKPLNQSDALEIIQSQLQGWKRMQKGQPPAVLRPEPAPTAQDDIGSSDAPPDPAEILLILEDWRKSWEEGNLERHMALFSQEKRGKNISYAMWKGIKKRMFHRHKNVEIRVERPNVKLGKGHVLVVFDQIFRSDQMKTFGQKTIDLVREGPGWMIVGERFVPGKEVKKNNEISASPIEDSTASNPQNEILQILDEWRKSWEEGNLDRHMTYFSNQPTLNDRNRTVVPSKVWRKIKKPMFDHYKKVEIRLESPVVNQRGGRWILTCDQTFSSDKIKSFGRKIFEFVREGSEWKIVKEEFAKLR